jgi:hypothetical protein
MKDIIGADLGSQVLSPAPPAFIGLGKTFNGTVAD